MNQGPFLSRTSAVSYLGHVSKRQQGIQGITCECCQNSCSLGELRDYCRLPSVGLWAVKRGHTSVMDSSHSEQSGAQFTNKDDVKYSLDQVEGQADASTNYEKRGFPSYALYWWGCFTENQSSQWHGNYITKYTTMSYFRSLWYKIC